MFNRPRLSMFTIWHKSLCCPLQTVKPAQRLDFSVNTSQRSTLSQLIRSTSVNGSVTKEFKDRLPSVPRKCSRRAFAPHISRIMQLQQDTMLLSTKSSQNPKWCDMIWREKNTDWKWWHKYRLTSCYLLAPMLWTPLVVHHSELLFGDRWFLSKLEPRVYPAWSWQNVACIIDAKNTITIYNALRHNLMARTMDFLSK